MIQKMKSKTTSKAKIMLKPPPPLINLTKSLYASSNLLCCNKKNRVHGSSFNTLFFSLSPMLSASPQAKRGHVLVLN